MTVKILTIDDLTPEKWDAFVRSHPDGSLYHLSAWHRTIEESYGYQTRYFTLFDENGEIRSALPVVNLRNLLMGRRSVSYPFSDYCDPLVGETADLIPLVGAVSAEDENLEIRTRWEALEIDGLKPDISFSDYSISLLEEPEILYSRLHKSCIQRRIRKSEREGVEIREGHSLDDLRDFYRLQLKTRRRLGLPCQPFRFFRNLRRNFSASDEFRIISASCRGRVVGSLLLVGFRSADAPERNTLYYKYGASDDRYFRLGFNAALFWRAILLAREEGYSRLDLGRASDANEKSLAEFKQRLGADKVPLCYFFSSRAYSDSGESVAARAAGRFFRLAPPFVSRLAGRFFYRYLG